MQVATNDDGKQNLELISYMFIGTHMPSCFGQIEINQQKYQFQHVQYVAF
jgi:hypothetical protein